ncbi:MAG: cadherin-like beta sandwich domain-containing protein, partial [Akkermansiaceae bacterium]|nr:cadherin-like beta sandwich domain-containing protein [Akkermansiaceae bacterium]
DGLGSPIPKAIAQTGLLAGKRVTAIATRRYHNLALCSDGTLIGWGDNSYGQLGNGVSSSRSELTAVDRTGVLSGKSVTGIATGSNHSLALCSDGTLAAWGANDYGQLGNNSTTTSYRPMLVDRSGVLAGKTVTAIASGTTHNLVLCADGTLAAWGAGSSGQLGNGLTSYSSVPVLVNRSGVLAGKTVTRVQAGDGFSLVLCSDGTMAAWGSNNSGALGNGGTASSNVPVAVGTTGLAAGERVVAVAAGLGHSLALVAMPPPPSAATLAATSLLDAEATLNGRVEANGNSATVLFEYGPTTAYGFTAAAVPATVDGTTPTAVSARITGLSHGSTYHFRVVATSATGTVRGEDLVFATNSTAALANLVASTGSLSPAFSPLRTSYDLTVPHGVTSLSVTPTPADDHASIAVNGTPLAAGAASQSIPLDPGASSIQIAVTSADGASTLTYAVTVTRLPEVFSFASSSFVPVSAGGFSISGPATLELLHAPAPGAVLTLLRNTGGAPLGGRFDNLAHGATIFLSHDGITYPFRVNYIGGDGNDLVLEWANTRLLAWGANTYGQLGDGTLTTRLVPSAVDVSGALAGRPVLRGGCGEQHSAVLCADGSLLAWGDNQYRQLGTGGSTSSQTPVEVVRTGALSDKTIVDLSVGGYHGLVLCDDGTVYGWGANDGGQLGDGSTTHRSTPVAVQTGGVLAGRRVTAIAAGRTHNLALCDDGTVVSWGNNSNGQLGNGGTTASTVPVAVDQSGVLAGKRVTALAAGDGSSYALCSDGTVAAWGGNGNGQLGDNSTTTRLAPVLVQNSGVLAGKSVVSLAAGASHAVVLCSDGTLAAWGYNYSGQLGNGSMYSSSSVPVLVNRTGVLAGKTIRSVHASSARSFALCDDGTLAAWGNNASGALGNNSTSNVSTPVLVSTANLRAGERMIRPLNGSTAASNLVIVASPVPAIASTLAATGIGDHGAVLGGTVNANGQTTAVWFEYGATAAYGATTAASPATVSGAVPTAVGATLSNLVAGTSYHYRVVAESGGGIIRGADMTFTTTAHSSLAGLALSKGTLIPAFSATRLTYQAMVDHPTESVTLIAQAADAGATVTVNGTAMPAGGPGVPVALAIGENTVTVAVNEPVSDQTTAYTLTIFRLPEVFAFTSPGTVPLRIGSFAGGGNHARFALDFTPAAPVNLLVVDNTGDDPVASPFDNLPQGQRVELERGGLWYPFLVNYH